VGNLGADGGIILKGILKK